jgi:hypothetical protein
MIIIPITGSEIVSRFAFLKNKSSSSYNGISNRILKFCGKFLGKTLAYILNKSLTEGKFPDHLKYPVLNPLFKKGGKFELTNQLTYFLASRFFEDF